MWILYCFCLFALVSGQDDVQLPPSITKDPVREVIFRVNQDINLTCSATGTPPIKFEWRQNGRSRNITNSTFILLGVSVGDLTIFNATSHDEGFYQCFASNQYGTALSTVAFLHDESPTYVNITVEEGQPFVIYAARGNGFPTSKYNWTTTTGSDDTNPKTYVLSQRVRDTWNGDLHFAYAQENDSLSGNIYKSTVVNGSSNTILGESYTRVTVTKNSESPSDFPPNITYFAKKQVVNLTGVTLELKCFFSGKPLPNITWSRPRKSLPDGRHEIPSSHYGTLLKIYSTTESDEGDYVCTAENVNGTANHTFSIRDEEIVFSTEPIFRQVSDGPYNVNVTEGDSITFNCSAFAKLNATVVWLRNGKSINVTKAPTRFVFSNDSRSLTIRNVCRDCCDPGRKTDLMVIQCNASNARGYAFAQGYLNVLSSRKFPQNASWTQTNYIGCMDKEFSDLLEMVKGDALKKQTVVTDIANQLSALTNKNEGLSSGNLNASVMIIMQLADLLRDRNISLNETEIKSLVQVISNVLQTNNAASWKELAKVNGDALKNRTVVAEIVRLLLALTNKSDGLSPGNLNASVMIIKQLAVLLRDRTISLNETEIQSLVQVISNVLQTNNVASWKELEKVDKNIASAVLSIVDDFGLVAANLSTPGHVTVSTDNLVLEAWSFEKSNLPLQIEFPKASQWGENRGDGISISLETLKGISSDSQPTLNMWGVYYRTIDKILPGKKDSDYDVNSRILSFTIGGLETNQTLKPPVTITLRHNQDKRRSYPRTCAFWNFNRNDWDSYGCSVIWTNSTHTICSCDHLTNFAILMSRNPVKNDLLSLISIIGCSISVACLILTAIVYVVTWKHAKSSQAALLLNLCIALIIAYIIFMAGADKFDSNLYSWVGCKVVAALLHYFFLVAFFIMLAEGIDMVLYIFFVFHVRRTRETVMLIASAWVLPLSIVGVSLGVTKVEGYGHKEACWLSDKKGLIWAFIGPVLCIIAINLVILVIILRLISQKKALLAGNGKKRDEIRATIWNLSVMCPVLGLGWLFGIFSVSFDHVVFQYVFVIANSLHGMLIFIIYALFHNKKMNEKISAVYSKYIGRCGKTGPSVFYKLSSSQDNSTSSTSNTQLTSAQEKSTHGAAPGYGVIATTFVSSAREPGERCSGDPLLPKQHPQKGQKK